jgi:hypothetical protein
MSRRACLTAVVVVAAALAARPAAAFREQLYLPAEAVASDAFGGAVAADGDVVAAGGAIGGVPTVVVLRRAGRSFVEQARLVDPTGGRTGFGASVALSSGLLVVGAPDDDGAARDAGAAHVFRWDGATWRHEARLVATGATTGELAGYSVAVDGDVVALGAPGRSGASSNEGAVRVFRWNGVAWSEEALLVAPDAGAGQVFGFSVSASGDVMVAGAPLHGGGGEAAGAAYAFRWDGATWRSESTLVPADNQAGDTFGHAIVVRGARMIVGAPTSSTEELQAGAAYEFRHDGAAWSEATRLSPPGARSGRLLGWALALAGDLLVIGAREECDVGDCVGQPGRAHVLQWDGASWVQDVVFEDVSLGRRDGVGSAVAASDVVIALGAPARPDEDFLPAGRGGVHLLTCGEPSALALDGSVVPLRLARLGASLTLTWEPSGAARFGAYRGTIPALRAGYDHRAVTCDLGTASAALALGAGAEYFLVGDRCLGGQVSLGRDAFGSERPRGRPDCP